MYVYIYTHTHIYKYIAIYKPPSKHKLKIYNRYTHTHKERNPNNIKDDHQITREGDKRRKDQKLQKQSLNNEQNGNKYIPINNYFTCKWTKCSNQKT